MEYGEYYKSFDPEPYYRERGWLIGSGKVGGKAKGLSFAHEVLKSNGMLEEVFLPRCTFVITTSVFEEFMEENRLWDRLLDLREHSDAPKLHRICQEAVLPQSVDEDLERILDLIDTPMSVRSSSILEDDVNLSFAGKYATKFVANSGDRDSRRKDLEAAIKEVYASTYNPAAREYKRKHNILWGGERMGVLIQPIVGRMRENKYYPELAGAAFSQVFRRPSPRIKKEDGVARICFGLGTRTVDRSFARTFYLTNPNLRPEGNRPSEIVSHSQEQFDYVDIEHNAFMTAYAANNIKMISKKHKMAQTYLQWFDDNMFHWLLADTNDMVAPRAVFTFAELPQKCPQLFIRIKRLLQLFEKELQLPTDMEFTYESAEDEFTLVQLRPLSVYDDRGKVEIPAVDPEKVILFGSYAENSAKEDSDLDLLIIKDSEIPSNKRCRELRKKLRGLKIPIDLLMYTPSEIEEFILQYPSVKDVCVIGLAYHRQRCSEIPDADHDERLNAVVTESGVEFFDKKLEG